MLPGKRQREIPGRRRSIAGTRYAHTTIIEIPITRDVEIVIRGAAITISESNSVDSMGRTGYLCMVQIRLPNIRWNRMFLKEDMSHKEHLLFLHDRYPQRWNR